MHIYKITNQKNGKIYVGKKLGLFSDCLGYLGSGLLIRQAVKKYGKENFSKVLLEVCDSLESLNNREKYWIQTLNATKRGVGYNIAIGGNGGDIITNHPNREDILIKYSVAKLGKKCTEETKHKISVANTGKRHTAWNKGRTGIFSTETIKKMRERMLGCVSNMRGKKMSDASRLKMRLAKLGKPSNRRGAKVTEETKQKQRELAKIRWQDPVYRQRIYESRGLIKA